MPIISKDAYLEHYGRLGMKWYQHKFGDADGRAVYAQKGLERISKQDAKAQEAHRRADVSASRAKRAENKSKQLEGKFIFRFGVVDEIRERLLDKRANRTQKSAHRNERRAAAADRRIQKTVDYLNKNLSDVAVKDVPANLIASGEKYMVQFLKNDVSKARSVKEIKDLQKSMRKAKADQLYYGKSDLKDFMTPTEYENWKAKYGEK